MNEISTKIKYIYSRYLIIAICFIIGYPTFRWYFDYKLGILNLNKEILDFWIPISFPIILIMILLRKRIRLLNIRSSYNKGHFIYLITAALSIIFPTLISLHYIDSSFRQLRQIETPQEIIEVNNKDCYLISDFNVSIKHAKTHITSRPGGRYGSHLDFTTYYVVPIVENDKKIDLANHMYWYCFKFESFMTGKANDNGKFENWDIFQKQNDQKFKQYNFSNFEYLQFVSNTNDQEGYIKAVMRGQKNNNLDKLIILEPVYEPFVDQTEIKFNWIIASFGIGAFVFFIMILIPSINNKVK
ncbi:hypothetical protein [Marinigracilibium pacificum]|uniref:Uncharacterized protein n=1 Tax=Marinigracilibium pacificum TaxID=2729599 RepID=A0A848J330_9BACT|nr:hypothetical protein [Marinigracilibium pacificum]NMM48894.1 hypothetical protein [Marinigracilibium pacificum]